MLAIDPAVLTVFRWAGVCAGREAGADFFGDDCGLGVGDLAGDGPLECCRLLASSEEDSEQFADETRREELVESSALPGKKNGASVCFLLERMWLFFLPDSVIEPYRPSSTSSLCMGSLLSAPMLMYEALGVP